jgi:D-glycero-alpha-D-manno-heptose-7-phosphate kinase
MTNHQSNHEPELSAKSCDFTCTATAPTRIDLAGGTLDIWPLTPIIQEKHELWGDPVLTVNIAIDLYASAIINATKSSKESWTFTDATQNTSVVCNSLSNENGSQYPLHRAVSRHNWALLRKNELLNVRISSDARAPRGSGLGGSSSLVVAMMAAFYMALENKNPQSLELCEAAKNLEAGILGSLAGDQDHIAAAFGGIQAVSHSSSGTTTSRLNANGNELMEHIVLAHSGQQHFSAFNNWMILEKALTGDTTLLKKMALIAELARETLEPICKGEWESLARIMNREWHIRRTLADGITTPVLNKLYDAAISAGSCGGKVCGAGGGGVLVMLVDSKLTKTRVQKKIEEEGGILLDAGFAPEGVTCAVT